MRKTLAERQHGEDWTFTVLSESVDVDTTKQRTPDVLSIYCEDGQVGCDIPLSLLEEMLEEAGGKTVIKLIKFTDVTLPGWYLHVDITRHLGVESPTGDGSTSFAQPESGETPGGALTPDRLTTPTGLLDQLT